MARALLDTEHALEMQYLDLALKASNFEYIWVPHEQLEVQYLILASEPKLPGRAHKFVEVS